MENLQKSRLTEAVGLMAAGLIATALVPQAVLMWLNAPNPATGVSSASFTIFFIASILWLVYGARIRSFPIVICNIAGALVSAAILLYKLIYG